MPNIGQTTQGKEIGKKSKCKYIWIACPICQKERWVQYYSGKPVNLNCNSCANSISHMNIPTGRTREKSYFWKGGRRKDSFGYIQVYIEESSPYYNMANSVRCILEHRLIMAKYLDRCLTPDELVHHINGIKDDNRLENLRLTTKKTHKSEDEYHEGYLAGFYDAMQTMINKSKLEAIHDW